VVPAEVFGHGAEHLVVVGHPERLSSGFVAHERE
jgi:hypothetical protein